MLEETWYLNGDLCEPLKTQIEKAVFLLPERKQLAAETTQQRTEEFVDS